MDLAALLNGSVVVITGGTGTLGQALVGTLLRDYRLRQLRVLSRGWLRQAEMQRRWPEGRDSPVRYLIGDVRSESRLVEAFEDADCVIHAAALKDVPACERNPTEAKATNTDGTANAVRAAKTCGVSRFVFISTDKAAAPLNTYGASKALAEKLVVAANNMAGAHGPRYACCRYGNVWGSNGSVVPLWREEAKTGCLTLTDADATRFTIMLDAAVEFVLSSLAMLKGGEIFVPKLPAYGLRDLAYAVAPDCDVRTVGLRPGEKRHECMVSAEESRQTVDLGDRFAILPALTWQARAMWPEAKPVPEGFCYTSDNARRLTPEELRDMVDG